MGGDPNIPDTWKNRKMLEGWRCGIVGEGKEVEEVGESRRKPHGDSPLPIYSQLFANLRVNPQKLFTLS
jgi:hypothetical protein